MLRSPVSATPKAPDECGSSSHASRPQVPAGAGPASVVVRWSISTDHPELRPQPDAAAEETVPGWTYRPAALVPAVTGLLAPRWNRSISTTCPPHGRPCDGQPRNAGRPDVAGVAPYAVDRALGDPRHAGPGGPRRFGVRTGTADAANRDGVRDGMGQTGGHGRARGGAVQRRAATARVGRAGGGAGGVVLQPQPRPGPRHRPETVAAGCGRAGRAAAGAVAGAAAGAVSRRHSDRDAAVRRQPAGRVSAGPRHPGGRPVARWSDIDRDLDRGAPGRGGGRCRAAGRRAPRGVLRI